MNKYTNELMQKIRSLEDRLDALEHMVVSLSKVKDDRPLTEQMWDSTKEAIERLLNEARRKTIS